MFYSIQLCPLLRHVLSVKRDDHHHLRCATCCSDGRLCNQHSACSPNISTSTVKHTTTTPTTLGPSLNGKILIRQVFYYTPANCVCGRVYCFHVALSVLMNGSVSITFCFLNILKRHGWHFIKLNKTFVCSRQILLINQKTNGAVALT